MQSITEILAQELGQKLEYVENVVNLMDEGNTIPFIARYRKEMHGAMDDTTLRNLETRLTYLRNLQQRRDEVKKSIENQGKLTEELAAAIDRAATMTEVEDLYRPYKQKRRTRGSIAREKGLEPLAEQIFAQDGQDPAVLAGDFVDPEKGVNSVEEALQGANDIIAENLSDDADIRKALRELVMRKGVFTCKAADDAEEDGVYKLYYDFSQLVSRLLDHQILAMNRGEKEGILKPNVALVGNEGAALVCRAALKPTMHVSAFVRAAAEDAYERLIFPSIQREVRGELSDRAYEGAIHNFALNLKPLLMQPPVKGFAPMGLPSLAKKAEQAVSLMVRSLRQAYQNPEDMDARATLMQASALTGPAFARQRGGYVHALARVLQNAYGLDYAEVCAAVLPDYLLGSGDLKRLAHIARETGIAPIDVDDMSAKESLVNWIISLCEEFQLPQVFEGIERRDLYRLATQAMALCSSSLPPDMLRQQLEQTLEALMAQPERISIDAAEIVERQKAYFAQGDTLSAAFRRDALSRLRRAILAHEEDITRALHQDLGKSASESYMCEIGMTLSELKWMLRHVGRHCRRHYVPTPLAQFSAESFTVRNPYGVALIMAPWNYPFLLTMSPLLGAIAAGNCCVVKPSAYAPATSAVVRDICRECFPQDFVAVVEGGRTENQALMAQEFDKIFFSGSPAVGKEVLRRAAEHYTPVTLELGGKSPVVVDRTANLPLAAKRIAFGKLLNAGQTCIAPDYILIDRRVKDRFIDLLRQQLTAQAGENALVNSDYVRMVNRKHFDRVMGLIDPRKVVAGGQCDPETLRIQPTILDNVTAEDAVMQEEIFGPVLPIIAVEDAEEAIRFINARPHPLACYLFSHDRAVQKRFLSAVPYGGGCINDVIIHLATSRMPFGGMGMSGMGNYHGQKSLDAFSHEKAIVKKHTWIDLPFRYAPYSKAKDRLIRFFLR